MNNKQRTNKTKRSKSMRQSKDNYIQSNGLTVKQNQRLNEFFRDIRKYPDYSLIKYFCNPAYKNYRYGNTHPEYSGLINKKYIYHPMCYYEPEEETKEEKEESVLDEDNKEYKEKIKYYNEMLGEEGINNLEDLRKYPIYTKEDYWENKKREIEERNKRKEELKKLKRKEENTQSCPMCSENKPLLSGYLLNEKKEEENKGYVSCIHHTKKFFSLKDSDPRNWKRNPNFTKTIVPAGKPYKKSDPLYLFRENKTKGNEWVDN